MGKEFQTSSRTSRGAVLSRHAAPAPAPLRAVAAQDGPGNDRGRARSLLVLSLVCAVLLIAAPVAIMLSTSPPEEAGQKTEVFTGTDRDTGESDDDGVSGRDTDVRDAGPAADEPSPSVPGLPGQETASGVGVPGGEDAGVGAPGASDAPQAPGAPGATAGSPGSGPAAPKWTGGTIGDVPGTAVQGGTRAPGTIVPPGTSPIQILPSKSPAADAPPTPAPNSTPAPNPPPEPQPGKDVDGVACPCEVVDGVLISVSRLDGGVLAPAGGLSGR